MAMEESTPSNLDDYSISSTVIKFDRPIPLLRGPLPASLSDNPSVGPFVLAFRDSRAWASAFKACEHKIIEQCEEGARIGCAVSASKKCKPPWWKALVAPKPFDLKERELCETREMADCLASTKEKCVGFARDKCLLPFKDARIKVGNRVLKPKDAAKLIGWASKPESEKDFWLMSQMGSLYLIRDDLGVKYCKASELLGSDDCVQCILGDWQQGTEN